jgi:hypothetical protein
MAGNLTAMIASIFSGSAVTPDPYFKNTTLLLPGNGTNGATNNTFLDASTNNFTITRNGNTTQGTFSPFSQTGWGNYFDGSGDYLSTTNVAALRLGAGDFTCEVWIYPLRLTNTNGQAIFGTYSFVTPSNLDRGWLVQLNSSGYPNFLILNPTGAGVFASITSSTLVNINAWNHIAAVRSGTGSNNISLYLNGTLVGSATSNGDDTFSATDFHIATYRSDFLSPSVGNSGVSFQGYISNLRIVKGTAVYTSNFTPPTTPLTAISGTSLLTCQSNRFIDTNTQSTPLTITINGNTSVQAFSPFNPTASWSAATYGGSGYFDGNGDYLSGTLTGATAGTGSVTYEFFVYPITRGFIFQTRTGGSGGDGIDCYITTNGVTATTSGNYIANDAGSIKLNEWAHIAIVRNGASAWTTYINGTSVATATSGITLSGTSLIVGANTGGANASNAYISNFRIVRSAVYTSNFTPPTAPLTAITNTSLLLNFTNAGIYDATSKNDLETVGNAQISTTQSKWGGSSMAFDGTTDYLICYDSPTSEFGGANFTLELWVNTTSSSQYDSLITRDPSSTAGSWSLLMNSASSTSGDVAFWAYDYNSYSAAMVITTGASIRDGNWHHVALVRNGSSWVIYIDGTSRGTQTSSITVGNSTANLWIANNQGTAGRDFSGYMQDVRLTIGVARYTANFTPPTAAFPTL